MWNCVNLKTINGTFLKIGNCFEYGINAPGNDMTSFATTSIIQCRAECLEQPDCMGLAYSTSGKFCFLKNGLPSRN
jgi:hypothetical protein